MPRGQEELLIAGPLLAAEVLRRHGRLRLRALGGSMWPAIQSGDVLEIDHCRADAVRPGEVILTLGHERLCAHRLIKRFVEHNEPFLVTRGDSHWQCDPAQPAAQLLGRVTALVRNGCVRELSSRLTWLERVRGLAQSAWTRVSRRARVWGLALAFHRTRASLPIAPRRSADTPPVRRRASAPASR